MSASPRDRESVNPRVRESAVCTLHYARGQIDGLRMMVEEVVVHGPQLSGALLQEGKLIGS